MMPITVDIMNDYNDAELDWQTVDGYRKQFDQFLNRFSDCFARTEGRKHLQRYVNGQLSGLPRKNCEAIADQAGIPPRTLQDFLAIHTWDHERATDTLQQIVAQEHHDPQSIGLIDETSFAKRGPHTACVQRQYCGSTGKIDNCVVSVHLGYASHDSRFHCMLDGQLTLPESWADDMPRCKNAGIPEDLFHRPKWKIALELLGRAASNGVRFGWLTFDEGYGCCKQFLEALQSRGQNYVAEVPKSFCGWAQEPVVLQKEHYRQRKTGRPRRFPRLSAKSPRACEVQNLLKYSSKMRELPWENFHIKDTDKGPMVWKVKACRFRYQLAGNDRRPNIPLPSAPGWLLVAESQHTGEVKYFVSNAPAGTPIETLIHVAFSRWQIERLFQDDKSRLGMDQFECRGWVSIRRHLILTAVSHSFLAKLGRQLESGGKKVCVAQPVVPSGGRVVSSAWGAAV